MSKLKNEVTRRAPIVTVMGHVDHGKTSILDKIRDTEVQKGEHGGITQSIGAYQVAHKGKDITFIDTPGHAAFSKMRARGSDVADVVILVVAADDGVQPQTIEALNHARAAESVILVVINKIDLEAANPTLVKKQLHDQGLEIEEYGGNTKVFETSAETGKGLDELLDGIIKVAEELDLNVPASSEPKGVVIESKLDQKRGPVVTLVITEGSFSMRDSFIAGMAYGRIKNMQDWQGNPLKTAGPSTPVEILGFDNVPEVGAEVKYVAKYKLAQKEAMQNKANEEVESISMMDRVQKAFLSGDIKEIPLVVKADSQGALEAVTDMVNNTEEQEVKLNILHSGIGDVSENDVFLAMPVSAVIVSYNVGITASAERLARKEGVFHRNYNVIYHLIDELKDVIKGELAALAKKVLGVAKVKKLFELTNGDIVAGSLITEGTINKGAKAEVLRNDEIIFEDLRITSLKQGKEDVGHVKEKEECGIILNGDIELMEGDVIQTIE